MRTPRDLGLLPSAVDAMVGAVVGLAVVINAAAWWTPHAAGARRLDVVGWLAVAVVVAGVASCRRHPVAAFVTIEAGTLVWLLGGYDGWVVLAAPIIACYEVTLLRGGWAGAAAALVNVAVGATTVVARWGEAGVYEAVAAGSALGGVAVVVGLAVGYQRAYAAMLRDRIAQAERDREVEARRRAEQERLRIARDLHDIVAHSITTINVQAATAAYVIDREPAAPAAREALLAIKQASGEAMGELRAMLGMLRQTDDNGQPLRPAPGLAELDALAAEVRAAGVDLDLIQQGTPGIVPASVQLTVYRIVQESLTNVLRHAAAQRATVTLACEADAVTVEVVDDGRGGSPPTAGKGHGLIGMRERVQTSGGTLEVGPAGERGFRVWCRIPRREPG